MQKSLYDVEHAINMYADGFVILPASQIYDEASLAPHKHIILKSHIYMIGLMPHVELMDITQNARSVQVKLRLGGKAIEKKLELPQGFDLAEDDTGFFIRDGSGKKLAFDLPALLPAPMAFRVLYIGQAFGKDAERNALQRLLSHETLQKIALTEHTPDHQIYVLLLELIDANRNFTVFMPDAVDTSTSEQRIEAGTTKLFETTKKERVSLFEAAFIRYFQPKFNKEFKDSFPSTNMKLLAQCYEKDFQAVIAEISIDKMPCMLCSDTVKAAPDHIASFDLHDQAERQNFFAISKSPLG